MDLLIWGKPCDGNNKGFIIVLSIGLVLQDLLCLVKPHDGKKRWFIIYFSISLCMQEILCLGIAVLETKEALSLFSRSVCAWRTFCGWVCPMFERKEALSLFSWSDVARRTFCVWVCPVLKSKWLHHCFLDRSAQAWPFVTRYACVWKKKVFFIIFSINLCSQDVCFRMPWVGKKRGFIIVFFISLCMKDPVLERKEAVSLFPRSVCACRTFRVWVWSVLERNMAVSLFHWSVVAYRTFCV